MTTLQELFPLEIPMEPLLLLKLKGKHLVVVSGKLMLTKQADGDITIMESQLHGIGQLTMSLIVMGLLNHPQSKRESLLKL